MRLNLGCGKDIKEGYLNIDFVKWDDRIRVMDITKLPLVLPANECEEVILSHILEHLPDYPDLIEDLYRVCKHGAVIKITVPHMAARNAWTDPTHCRYFIERTFHYFDLTDKTIAHNPFNGRNWKLRVKTKITFGWWWMKPIELLANTFKGFYENHLMFVFQPCDIYAELEVIKDGQ